MNARKFTSMLNETQTKVRDLHRVAMQAGELERVAEWAAVFELINQTREALRMGDVEAAHSFSTHAAELGWLTQTAAASHSSP